LCHCHRKRAASATEDLAATIPHLDTLTADIGVERFEFCQAFNSYLARLGPDTPVKNLRKFPQLFYLPGCIPGALYLQIVL
jgi:hypothetical protein